MFSKISAEQIVGWNVISVPPYYSLSSGWMTAMMSEAALGKVKPVKVHHLAPYRYKIINKFLL